MEQIFSELFSHWIDPALRGKDWKIKPLILGQKGGRRSGNCRKEKSQAIKAMAYN